MKDYLVLYYSKTGNSKFFAEKTAQALNADINAIVPAINGLLGLIFITLFRIGVKTNIQLKDLELYDEVIIWGPVWMGMLIAPLRNVLKSCTKASKKVHFALTCETPESAKNDKYGYTKVLNDAKSLADGFIKTTDAFSLAVLKESAEQWTPKLSKKPRISEEKFQLLFKKKFDEFVNKIRN